MSMDAGTMCFCGAPKLHKLSSILIFVIADLDCPRAAESKISRDNPKKSDIPQL